MSSMKSSSSRSVAPAGRRDGKADRRLGLIAVAVIAIVAVAMVLFTSKIGTPGASSAAPAPGADYAVGSPGPGEQAPDFVLPSTSGEDVALEDYSGQSTLFYFHEGLGCQPCWDQIRDLEAAEADLAAAGVDELVTVTSGPADLIGRKMADDGLSSIALADTDLTIAQQYETNKYGMMGETRNGHSFILVGPDGEIQWRADYGGAPDYTMYVPVPQLLEDLEAGRDDQ